MLGEQHISFASHACLCLRLCLDALLARASAKKGDACCTALSRGSQCCCGIPEISLLRTNKWGNLLRFSTAGKGKHRQVGRRLGRAVLACVRIHLQRYFPGSFRGIGQAFLRDISEASAAESLVSFHCLSANLGPTTSLDRRALLIVPVAPGVVLPGAFTRRARSCRHLGRACLFTHGSAEVCS